MSEEEKKKEIQECLDLINEYFSRVDKIPNHIILVRNKLRKILGLYD